MSCSESRVQIMNLSFFWKQSSYWVEPIYLYLPIMSKTCACQAAGILVHVKLKKRGNNQYKKIIRIQLRLKSKSMMISYGETCSI